MTEIVLIGSNLPTIYETVSAIYKNSPSPNANPRRVFTSNFSRAILDHWETVFPAEFLVTKRAVDKKLAVLLKKYDNIFKKPETKDKKLKEYKEFHNFLFDLLAPKFRNQTELLPNELKDFYEDQISERKMSFEDVDMGYLYSRLDSLRRSDVHLNDSGNYESDFDEFSENDSKQSNKPSNVELRQVFYRFIDYDIKILFSIIKFARFK